MFTRRSSERVKGGQNGQDIDRKSLGCKQFVDASISRINLVRTSLKGLKNEVNVQVGQESSGSGSEQAKAAIPMAGRLHNYQACYQPQEADRTPAALVPNRRHIPQRTVKSWLPTPENNTKSCKVSMPWSRLSLFVQNNRDCPRNSQMNASVYLGPWGRPGRQDRRTLTPTPRQRRHNNTLLLIPTCAAL